MRILGIFFALFAGLASLLMTVCGGGFFVALAYNQIRALTSRNGQAGAGSMLPLLLLAAVMAAIGGWLFSQCVKYIRREWRDRDQG